MADDFPIRRYECKSCGALIDIDREKDISQHKCCKNPVHVLQLTTFTKEEWDNAKIELGKCYEGIIELLGDYMDMPEEQMKLVSIWIIGTYFHDTFNTFPYLFFNAMKGSGKTRLLKIISELSKDGKGNVQTGITESVLFRMPKGKILVLDECESISSKDKGVLREYLNVCYKKGGVVSRTKKVRKDNQESYEIEEFEPFKPVVMANIWGMESVLGDRCITTVLEKSSKKLVVLKVEDFKNDMKFLDIKKKLSIFSVVVKFSEVSDVSRNVNMAWNNYINDRYNNTTTLTTQTTQTTQTTPLKEIQQEEMFNKIINTGIEGRNLELLFPLLIISNYLSDEVFDDILKIGTSIMDAKKDDEYTENKDISLIDYISRQEHKGGMYISIVEILEGYKKFLGEIDGDDKFVNSWWIGKSLKRLNLIKMKRRLNKGVEVILNVEKAKEKIKIFKSEPVKK